MLPAALLALGLGVVPLTEGPPRLGYGSGPPIGSAPARQDPDRTAPLPPSAEPALRAAVRRGLDALEQRQSLLRDGSVPVPSGETQCPVGVTALAALAWMAGGSTPTRGPHAGALVRALEYLLAHQSGPSEAWPGWISAAEDRASRSHGHGLATLAFSQAAALSPRSPLGGRLQEGLVSAVRHIERMQGSEGGWFYGPGRTSDHEGSVTVCLVQALRGARNAGVRVDPGSIGRAIEYVKGLQDESGGFRYSTTHPQVSVGLTAGCLSTLHAIGIYEGKEIESGYDYILRELASREVPVGSTPGAAVANPPTFLYYERLYLAQAYWQHRDLRHFRRWAEPEVRRVLAEQQEDGMWEDQVGARLGAERGYGASYATAMNCLFLSVPQGLLPIFRR